MRLLLHIQFTQVGIELYKVNNSGNVERPLIMVFYHDQQSIAILSKFIASYSFDKETLLTYTAVDGVRELGYGVGGLNKSILFEKLLPLLTLWHDGTKKF